jgi:hypothetical protein
MTLVKWYGAKAKDAAKKGAARGLMLGAEHLLEEANRIVPIEEGTLLRSGVTSLDEGAMRAAVSYDTPYSVVQHEDLTMSHDAGRQAKYLEQPLASERGKIQDLIAREIKAALG